MKTWKGIELPALPDRYLWLELLAEPAIARVNPNNVVSYCCWIGAQDQPVGACSVSFVNPPRPMMVFPSAQAAVDYAALHILLGVT